MKRKVFLFTLMMLFSFTALAQEYLKNWEKQAESGNIEAQLKLGEWYKWKNKDKKSLKWYQKAADLGNSDACYEMAQLCIKGVSKNDPSMWLLKAAENGNDEMKLKVVNQISSFYQKDKACELLCSLADNGDNAMKMKVVYQLSSINQQDKAIELLLSMAEKGDDFAKMQVADAFSSIGEKSKAIMLLKSLAEQSTSFDWTERIIKKLISLGNSELIHQPKIQELFCIKAKEQFERKEYQNAYTTLSQVIDKSDSPAKELLSELKSREQAIKVREQARKDSLDRLFDHGARWFGNMYNGVAIGSGDLSIPYQGQTIWVKISISDFASNGAPYRGKIYAFDNWFDLNSSGYYSSIVYRPSNSYSSNLITEYKYDSMNTLIAEIIKNVDKLKNAKRNLAKQKADQEKRQREEEQWKKTHYHSTPKEVRCMYCGGIGYKDVKDYDYTLHAWVKERQRCIYCYGRGYTLEHYY